MSPRFAPAGAAWLITGIVLFAAAILIGGFLMGMAMGGGMMGRFANAPQTPFTAQGDATVEMRGFQYFPRDLTINAGASVTWINYDNVPHNATDDDKVWATKNLHENDADTLTFTNPGEYTYYCTIHPSMKAKLIVR